MTQNEARFREWERLKEEGYADSDCRLLLAKDFWAHAHATAAEIVDRVAPGLIRDEFFVSPDEKQTNAFSQAPQEAVLYALAWGVGWELLRCPECGHRRRPVEQDASGDWHLVPAQEALHRNWRYVVCRNCRVLFDLAVLDEVDSE